MQHILVTVRSCINLEAENPFLLLICFDKTGRETGRKEKRRGKEDRTEKVPFLE